MDTRTSRFSNGVSPESYVTPELSCFEKDV